MNKKQIKLIHLLFSETNKINMPLWSNGGWAIDAKIEKITCDHEDIDITFPVNQKK